jgi:hypothetical protein
MDEDTIHVLGTDLSDPVQRPPSGRRARLIVIGVLVGAGVVFALSNSDTSDNQAATPATTLRTPTSVAKSVTSTTETTVPSVPTTLNDPVTFTAVNVEPLSGAEELLGEVALTPFPGGAGSGTLWVLRPGGSVVRRDNVPFRPGDYQYPMLMTGGSIAFADLSQGYLADPDLLEEAEPLVEASFITPGAAPGLIWLVGTGADWVAPLDVESRTVGERIDVSDLISWPLAGIAEGLVVTPVDEDTYGPVAYWSPSDGLQPISLRSPEQSGIHAASGTVAAVVSPGELSILDIASGNYLSASRLELGDGNVSEVCLSPDQQYAAVVGSTGEAYVVAVDTGVTLHRLAGVHSNNSVGWSDANQFVYIADTRGGTTVQTLNMVTGQVGLVAELTGYPTFWWLTASATMC